MHEYSELTELNEMNEIHENKSSCRGSTLIWHNVNVYTKDKTNGNSTNNLKRIINNSTGFIQPGTLMAVMGSRFDELGINSKQNSIDLIYNFLI